MARYAAETTISAEKSKAEIETMLRKAGATGYLSGWDTDRAFIAFMLSGRHIRITLPLPSPAEDRFTKTKDSYGRSKVRAPDAAHKIWEQACRQSWRALALVIKAKLEAVAARIAVFEDEFLAYIVTPDGKTVGELAKPALAIAYETGKMPPLLSYGGAK